MIRLTYHAEERFKQRLKRISEVLGKQEALEAVKYGVEKGIAMSKMLLRKGKKRIEYYYGRYKYVLVMDLKDNTIVTFFSPDLTPKEE